MIKEILEKCQSNNHSMSNEYQFFKQNRIILKNYAFMENYYFANKSFEIIKANIIIKSLLNKDRIEKLFSSISSRYLNNSEGLLKEIREEIAKLPLLNDNFQKIFIAFFDRATNLVYYDSIMKIEEFPYSTLINDIKSIFTNPFETYGDKIFDSGFTELVKIDEDSTSGAYYHYQLDTLYFINNQGFLDFQLNLFDKYLKFKDYSNIIDKLKIITKCYYNTDKNGMLEEMVKNKLISFKILDKVSSKLAKYYKLKTKKSEKGIKNAKV